MDIKSHLNSMEHLNTEGQLFYFRYQVMFYQFSLAQVANSSELWDKIRNFMF